MNLPTGTVTFLFTDIEGSTKLWERYPEAMRLALERHDVLLKAVIEGHKGYVFKTVGDAFCAAFPTAPDAVNAALEAQLALLQHVWGETGPIRVRMGLHTGEAAQRDNDYFGPTLNRVARLMALGYGQQILIGQTTYALVSQALPLDASLIDLGTHRLKDLAAPEHLWQLLHPALPQAFAPLKSLDYLPTNLPFQLTSFIGREKEMAEIKELLATTRLLTLTGSGGTGKTRLAVQASAEVLEQYADGVWLVELAALSDPDLVPQKVAEALSIREAPGEPMAKTLIHSLKDRQMLLVLDNCEHLLEASARLVEGLLRSCPKVSMLVSSREAFGIGGEHIYRVPSLSVPPLLFPPQVGGFQGEAIPSHAGGIAGGDRGGYTPQSLAQYESVRLFIERAVASRTDFTVTPQNASALASVCHHLDGIPLAIELAAARLRAMPLEQIETRLDSRFRLLTGGSRTALPRQQTLKALIDWSYDLLTAQEKLVLLRLAVFADGWTLEAAEFVCTLPSSLFPDEVLDLLTSLVDKSLVVYEEHGGKARYRLLESMRQYAVERLEETGEAEAVRKRHRDCFLALAEEADPKLRGAEQAEWLQRLEEEHENLRASLEWSLLEETGAGEALRLCGALQRFWWTRGHLLEGRQGCARALDRADAQRRTQERAKALNGAGVLAKEQGDYTSARAYLEESLTIQREIGDRGGMTRSLNNLGNVACSQGDYASAQAYHAESLAIQREIGDRVGIAISLNNLGNVAYVHGDYASAWANYEESLNIHRSIGNQSGAAMSLSCLGNLATDQGDHASALTYYTESLNICREIGDRVGMAYSLLGLGTAAKSQGDNTSARTYYEESLNLSRELGDRGGIAEALGNLGNVASFQGDYNFARSCYRESLNIQCEIGGRRSIAYCLEALANLAVKESRWEQAAMLLGAAEALREEIGALLLPHEQDQYSWKVTSAREALGEEVFSTTWTQGRSLTLEQAISYAQG